MTGAGRVPLRRVVAPAPVEPLDPCPVSDFGSAVQDAWAVAGRVSPPLLPVERVARLASVADEVVDAGVPRGLLRELVSGVADLAAELAVDAAVELMDLDGLPIRALPELVAAPRVTARAVTRVVVSPAGR